MVALPRGIAERTAALPAALAAHTVRVRKLARDLAERHGIDPEASELGAACHDLARHVRPDVLLEEAAMLGIRVHPVERLVPVMLHGPVAATWLKRDGEVSDSRIIEAVHCHTTGKRGMCAMSKVVFLADKLEPDKVRCRPELGEVLQLTGTHIDTALLEYLNRQIVRRVERGDLLHPSTLGLRNELVTSLPRSEFVTGQAELIEREVRQPW